MPTTGHGRPRNVSVNRFRPCLRDSAIYDPQVWAQEAYEAYGDHADWTSSDGARMPSWEFLGDTTQAHWTAAVSKILGDEPDLMDPDDLKNQIADLKNQIALEFVQRAQEIYDDPARKNPGRQAGIDQWMASFDNDLVRHIVEVKAIQDSGQVSRADYIDISASVIIESLASAEQVQSVVASWAAMLWKLAELTVLTHRDTTDG